MKKEFSFSERRYDIDWLRIMLILSVFLFHIGMFFNSYDWHIKNPERILWLDLVMAYLHRWRMPLLFLVSGVGTYFALGQRSALQFVGEQSRKLLIPLIFGMFVIVPPQVYIEKQAQYGSFLSFIPHITEGVYPEGNFSWHHLWFVLYLFICATAAIPFILVLRSRLGSNIYRTLERFSTIKGIFLVLTIPLFLSQFFLLQYFPRETHALINDWAYISYSFLFFLYGYMLLSNKALIKNLVTQRRIFAGLALFLTVLFFFDWFHSIDPYLNDTAQLFLSCLMELSIALTLISYAARYLNHDHSWRHHLNEAIYPFYILHQTAIIVVGYNLMNTLLPAGIKALILTLGSFFACITIYLLFIRPFSLTRLVFGMHIKRKGSKLKELKTKQFRAVS